MANLLTIAFHNMLEKKKTFANFTCGNLSGECGRFIQGLIGSFSTCRMSLPHLVQVGQQVHPEVLADPSAKA